MRALPDVGPDISITKLPRERPAYMHRVRGTLHAQFRSKTGERFSRALRTRNDEVAKARMAPLLEGLIRAGKLDRSARVCELYLPGRCPRCGRPFPGAI